MDPKIIFGLVFGTLTALVLFLNAKYEILHDESIQPKKKPYSYARAQLTWWTVIVISGFATITLYRHSIPTFSMGVLVLLGISSATTVAARITDISDQAKSEDLIRNMPGKNFLLDILSDSNGVSIHRLQAVLFNVIIGLWFIHETLSNMVVIPAMSLNTILPDIDTNNLILMGLSAGTYATLKTMENKNPAVAIPVKSANTVGINNENEIPPLA